ncbi:MAG: ribonuclease HII [Candidatus Nephrothrix sp. EaCA]|nr:MAG: ribonuclease HII [Candidatus Nephrothrix sp. EaCA]
MLKSSFGKEFVEAGCDASGCGCLAGPIVAAAVILPKKFKHRTLKDSKQLSAIRREALQKEIKEVALAWAVAEVSHQVVDEINTVNAAIRAMHEALDKLLVQPQLILVDGDRFQAYKDIPHRCIGKGDEKYLSIAAASVLAKTRFDELLKKSALEFPGYNWEKNAGYPTDEHYKAIQKLGITPYHRKTFKLSPKSLKPPNDSQPAKPEDESP